MTEPARHQTRDAAPADLAALVALEAQFPGDRMPPRQFRHHLRNPRARLRLLLRDGEAAGYSLVLTRQGSDIARLYSIAIASTARGTGVGSLLLQDAMRCARDAGCRRMRLEVRDDNRSAIRLYESHGFRAWAREPDYYEDGAPALRYERALDGPA